MSNTNSKGHIEYFQPIKARQIRLFDVLMMIFGVFAIVLSFNRSFTISGILFSLIVNIFIFSVYINPLFNKKYNATITDEELILYNIKRSKIKLKFNTIENVASEEGGLINISGTNGEKRYIYSIFLDEDDIEHFIYTITSRRELYINKVKHETERA